MNLTEYTYNLVKQIPSGRVSTYGAVAKALGNPDYARAVGKMMNKNPNADTMPCFKIVSSDGSLGGFGLGLDDKIRRLKRDGIDVKDGKIIGFEKVFFNDFKTDFPLKKLREEQLKLRDNVDLNDSFSKISTIAGIDVHYVKNDFKKACGACVVVDYESKEIIEEKTLNFDATFPYISTYLGYRELPIIGALIKKLASKPTVFMFDGNGILHPIYFGLASHAGVKFDISSIGVAKRLLCGNIEDDYVKLNGKKVGYLFYSSKNVKNPVYVSPGHKISFKTSIKIVKKMSKYRIPEPLRLAHILAKKELMT